MRFLRSKSGSISVEFSLLFPMLAFLFMGVAQFSLILYTNSSMQTAAREVTRQIAVNYTKPAEAAAAVARRMPKWAAESVSVSVKESEPGNPNSNEITLLASLPAGHASPLSLLNAFTASLDLSALVTMRQEEVL